MEPMRRRRPDENRNKPDGGIKCGISSPSSRREIRHQQHRTKGRLPLQQPMDSSRGGRTSAAFCRGKGVRDKLPTPSFYVWGNGAWANLSHVSEVTQLASGGETTEAPGRTASCSLNTLLHNRFPRPAHQRKAKSAMSACLQIGVKMRQLNKSDGKDKTSGHWVGITD